MYHNVFVNICNEWVSEELLIIVKYPCLRTESAYCVFLVGSDPEMCTARALQGTKHLWLWNNLVEKHLNAKYPIHPLESNLENCLFQANHIAEFWNTHKKLQGWRMEAAVTVWD